jgi:hypothetical protein
MKSFSVQGTFHLCPEKLIEARGDSGIGAASTSSATSVRAEVSSLLLWPRLGSAEGLLYLVLFGARKRPLAFSFHLRQASGQ